MRPITNFTKVQMSMNTNWNFDIGVIGIGNSDRLVLLCPQNSQIRVRGGMEPFYNGNTIAAEISIRDGQADCRIAGAHSPSANKANKSNFPSTNWQSYADLLTTFISEIDGRYPLKRK